MVEECQIFSKISKTTSYAESCFNKTPMKLIPDYQPVQKLYLCYTQKFANQTPDFTKTLCQIIDAVQRYVEIEMLVGHLDFPYLRMEAGRIPYDFKKVLFNFVSPNLSTLDDLMPIFAEGDDGAPTGLISQNPLLDRPRDLKNFNETMVGRLEYPSLETGLDLAPADLLVNEDLVLVSDRLLKGANPEEKLKFFADHFPRQSFYLIPYSSGEGAHDLEMLLWPIAPKTWIASEYPPGTPQAASVDLAVRILKDHQHTVYLVPVLEPVGEGQATPNYSNGVIVNQAALVPSYQRKEDDDVAGILREHHYTVYPIDCSSLILSGCGLRRIVKTAPKRLSSS